METLGDRIRILRENKNLKQSELAEMIGVKKSGVISNWERNLNKPDTDKLTALCVALDTTASYLLNYYGKEPDFSPEEQTHIKKYRTLDEYGKQAVDSILSIEHARIEEAEISKKNVYDFTASKAKFKEEKPQTIEMQVYLEKATAGLGNYLTGEGEYDLMTFPATEVPLKADFGIRISGDSMEPKINDGDIVWVKASHQIENGEIGIFILNGESYCKKLHIDYDKKIAELISLNTKYKPIEIREHDDLRTVGKVLL